MTKTTEELKREMYRLLKICVDFTDKGIAPNITLPSFESALEAYLEALRQERAGDDKTFNHASKTVAIIQGAYEAQQELVAKARAEAETLRNKLQAFEFANRSAAELLSEALREPSGLRKWSPCAPARRSQENASCNIPDALLLCPAHFIQTNCKQGHHFMVNSSGPDGGLHCLACGHHREIPQ